MRKYFLLLFASCLSAGHFLQAQNCSQPVTGTISAANVRTGTYTGQSLQATGEVELQAESAGQLDFGVCAEGFSATIGLQPSLFGSWSSSIPWISADNTPVPSIAIHTNVLPNGQVMTWQGHNDNHFAMGMGTDVFRWDPTSLAAIGPTVHLNWTNAFCTGHSFLADGKLLVTGGHDETVAPSSSGPGYIKGLPHTSTFDFTATAPGWQSRGNMQRNRWYPTNTTLSDGNVLTTAGETEPFLTTAQRWPELWISQTGTWAPPLTGAPKNLPTYPWMFALANSAAFYAGPGTDLGYLDPAATNPINLGPGLWTDATVPGRAYNLRNQGTAVMFWPGKILVLGGSNGVTVTNTAEIIDLTSGAFIPNTNFRQPAVMRAADMRNPRHHANATLLPDGTVLVTGGSRVPGSQDSSMGVLEAEIWTPPAPDASGAPGPGPGTWTTVSSMHEARMYHSTAALLPDGRVLSVGGEEVIDYDPAFTPNVNNHCTAEVYSPPYLFQPGRPVITFAPTSVSYGAPFAFDTPTPAAIDAVSWIRLSSVTHSFNMNQRFLRLPITGRSATGVTATAPANPGDCPPGHYLVYALRNGVPSEAKVVSIANNPCAATIALSTTVTAYDCTATAQATVSGTNLGTNYHWSIDGVYTPMYDGRTSVSIALDNCRPQATFAVEAIPLCGGSPQSASESVSAGPFIVNGSFCLCEGQ